MYMQERLNFNNYAHNENNEEKSDKVKIIMLNSKPFSYIDEFGNYQGFEYEILKEFLKEHKLDYEITLKNFPDTEIISYDEGAQRVSDGKYDIVIGQYTQNYKRKMFPVLYSRPLYLDVMGIYYKKSNNEVSSNFAWRISKVVIQFFILVLILSLILAFVHKLSSNKKITYIESLWRVSTSLLGANAHLDSQTRIGSEVSKKSHMNFIFLISRTLIIFLSVLLSLYLGAIITSERLANITTDLPFKNESSLYGKNIVVLKDTSDAATLNKYKTKFNYNVIEFESVDPGETLHEEVIKYFINNSEKENLDGVFIAVESLQSSDENILGRGEVVLEKSIGGWIINPNRTDLLLKLNKTQFRLRSKNGFKSLCDRYFKNPKLLCLQ
jgi:ABC-type amino acid transport substrate-binding protein